MKALEARKYHDIENRYQAITLIGDRCCSFFRVEGACLFVDDLDKSILEQMRYDFKGI